MAKTVGSKSFTFNRTDLMKVGKGLLIALTAAALTYLTELIPNVDFGVYTPLVVAAWSIIANMVRKFVVDNS